ncbi:Hypothetical_protein [Hexamita inflata]|uniref:Hypothetical_protein n=1 Tax=Hexamita inflata TaxID=28002 RepID=A0ABP1H8H3_9EUKA
MELVSEYIFPGELSVRSNQIQHTTSCYNTGTSFQTIEWPQMLLKLAKTIRRVSLLGSHGKWLEAVLKLNVSQKTRAAIIANQIAISKYHSSNKYITPLHGQHSPRGKDLCVKRPQFLVFQTTL